MTDRENLRSVSALLPRPPSGLIICTLFAKTEHSFIFDKKRSGKLLKMNFCSFKFAAVKPRDDNKVRQIFDATLKLVVKSGVAGVTMRQIAREAGIATGTLYIYFTDKEQLISQLYSTCRAAAIDAYFKGYNESFAYKK